MRTILNQSAQRIPATSILNVQPLKRQGKVLHNGNEEIVYDDQFLIQEDGSCLNKIRSEYCEFQYLSDISIIESIPVHWSRLTKRAQSFIDQISETLCFKHNGIAYRVYLFRTGNGYYDISCVKPFYATYRTEIQGRHPAYKYAGLGINYSCAEYNKKMDIWQIVAAYSSDNVHEQWGVSSGEWAKSLIRKGH